MPEFEAETEHIAHVTLTNPSSVGFDYVATLYMGSNLVEMAMASFHLNAGESKVIDLSVTMPSSAGTYPVYIGVSSGGENIILYQDPKGVTITTPVPKNWECPLCGEKFTTYTDLCTHLDSAHPAGDMQVGILARDVTGETARLQVAATENSVFHLWLENCVAIEVAVSPYMPSHQTYYVDVSGLLPGTEYLYVALAVAGDKVAHSAVHFTTAMVPGPPIPSDFAFSNMAVQQHTYPGSSDWYIEIDCDITNVGVAQTAEVTLWHSNDNTGYIWSELDYPSFAGFPGPLPGTWNAGKISLTLAAGESFHFHYGGGGGSVSATTYIVLTNSLGGQSEVLSLPAHG